MFQFRRFPTYAYFIQRRLIRYCRTGFPHSEISGSKPICGSPKLIAACHVLHRLLMPRHSPCALISLTSSERTAHPSLPPCRKSSLAPSLLLSGPDPLSLGSGPVPQNYGLCASAPDMVLLNHAGLRVSKCFTTSQLVVVLPITPEQLLPS